MCFHSVLVPNDEWLDKPFDLKALLTLPLRTLCKNLGVVNCRSKIKFECQRAITSKRNHDTVRNAWQWSVEFCWNSTEYCKETWPYKAHCLILFYVRCNEHLTWICDFNQYTIQCFLLIPWCSLVARMMRMRILPKYLPMLLMLMWVVPAIAGRAVFERGGVWQELPHALPAKWRRWKWNAKNYSFAWKSHRLLEIWKRCRKWWKRPKYFWI